MKTAANIACAILVSVAVCELVSGCGRRQQHVDAEPKSSSADQVATTENVPVPLASSAPSPSRSPSRGKTHTVYATWYDVPQNSLASRRAAGELTAAHDRYPLGTRLRVTHLGNGKSVVVRITDRGVPRGKAPLDLCKRAAEELDMLREGAAKVRVETLSDEDLAGAPPSDSPSAPAQP